MLPSLDNCLQCKLAESHGRVPNDKVIITMTTTTTMFIIIKQEDFEDYSFNGMLCVPW